MKFHANRLLQGLIVLFAVAVSAEQKCDTDGEQPNIVFLLVDDWGGGDVDICPDDSDFDTCPFRVRDEARRANLHTPRMKKMAEEGQILTNFYSPRAICTPSRAGYMTGRDPSRYGMIDNLFRILQSSSARGGLPTDEPSIAKVLKSQGYSTGYTGKWHMGATDGVDPWRFTPINHGFDYVKFFVEGSNGEQCEEGALNPPGDNNIYHMCSFDHIQDCEPENKTCTVVEQPIRWENVTARHLMKFKEFVDEHEDSDKPFFYQHAFLAVHVPWVPSRFFVSDPVMKYWTDFVNEVDWAVGYILDYLKVHAPNTLVVLSSDNGPFKESASSYCPQNCRWHTPEAQISGLPPTYGCSPCEESIVSDSTDLNIGGKGNTWEGGQHVPSLAWWPEAITPGTINPHVSSGLDLLPTFLEIAGGELPEGVVFDGKDISGHLCDPDIEAADMPEGEFVYWCGLYINAIRLGQYKVIYRAQKFVGATPHDTTPPNLCAQDGDCCPGSPSRLCICDELYVDSYQDDPKVIDLLTNPQEDISKALDRDDIIEQANEKRMELLQSVLDDRMVPQYSYNRTNSIEMQSRLGELPNFPNTDLCQNITIETGPYYSGPINGDPNDWMPSGKVTPDGCAFVPEDYQKSFLPGMNFSFYEFNNCSISGTYQGAECAQRLPCCQQEGYNGPFEYIKPDTIIEGWEGDTHACGCFENGPDSHFPEDQELQKAVCDWQKDVYEDLKARDELYFFKGFCKPSYCSDDTYSMIEHNQDQCDAIAKYGLSNAPTGNLFNLPYPETQHMTWQQIYPNQASPPPLVLNGGCQDDPNFEFIYTNKKGVEKNKGGCEFVAEKPKKRCGKPMYGSSVRNFCQKTCNYKGCDDS